MKGETVIFMDIYFITQVFSFVHSITNKLHCSLFTDHNVQFPNHRISSFEDNYAGYILLLHFSFSFVFFLFVENNRHPLVGHFSSLKKKRKKKQKVRSSRLRAAGFVTTTSSNSSTFRSVA